MIDICLIFPALNGIVLQARSGGPLRRCAAYVAANRGRSAVDVTPGSWGETQGIGLADGRPDMCGGWWAVIVVVGLACFACFFFYCMHSLLVAAVPD
jgi:hypothetical protein